MLTADQLTINNIRSELDRISVEMISLIQKYDMDATSPLQIIDMARLKITDPADYVRFLEISLEGRIYGEAATAIENEEKK